MQELAIELNKTLSGSVVESLLSPQGQRMYFPKGIVAQSAEAGTKATRYNATVGLATKNGQPMHLSDISSCFKEGVFKPSQIFNYAPGGGDKELRALWKEDMIAKNPSMKGKKCTLPLVTAGLTHAMSIVADLFVSEGDDVVCPNLFWDNYELIFSEKAHAHMVYFDFYDQNGQMNIEGMQKALLSCKGNTARIILNFPNNPTGYTPNENEAKAIVDAIIAVAETGKKVLVLSDDAYFGLFYENETAKESLFASLCDAHENIFAIKGDAATKEEMVWGFRIGFLTYGSKGLTDAQYDALVSKTLGQIRCTVSNCDRPGQTLLLKAMKEGMHRSDDKAKTFEEMKKRYLIIKEELKKYQGSGLLTPYAFNSGYFMAFDTNGHDAEELRVYLLDRYGIGAINIMGKTLRLAYCSVEPESIADLVKLIYQAAGEIWN